jgi:predicted exporter
MPRKYLYLALFVIGAVVPYLSFVPWLMDHGFDISRMVEELFANRISAFFGLDVVISALALFVFVSFEGRRAGVKHTWAPVVATLTIGVSAGLPLFLFLRESAMEPSTRL